MAELGRRRLAFGAPLVPLLPLLLLLAAAASSRMWPAGAQSRGAALVLPANNELETALYLNPALRARAAAAEPAPRPAEAPGEAPAPLPLEPTPASADGAAPSSPAGDIITLDHSPAGEMSNNVNVYEPASSSAPAAASSPGATAAAAAAGDFFFSASENVAPAPDADSNAWWALGVGADYERALALTADDYLEFCAKSELLVSGRQRNLCRMHPRVMSVVARGLRLAIEECQARFAASRWNCSLAGQPGQPAFGDFMRQANRERSFLNAVVAAGLAHAMTRACSQGELPEECACDKRIRARTNRASKLEWVACSDDLDFGARFSRDFTEAAAERAPADLLAGAGEPNSAATVNAHNYEVGRRVFKSAVDITCSCAGADQPGAACDRKRCWRHLAAFAEVGDELRRRYEAATHVQLSQSAPHKLRPVRRGVRKPKRRDLVYIDESPDYCQANSRLGVLGVQNRPCNSTSEGPDSCSLLCCGRGYQVVVEEADEECNCKFVWCCQVRCERCRRQLATDVCN